MTGEDPALRGLILEDDPGLSRAIAVMMRRCGIDVTVVRSAAEAVSEVERQRPAAMVIDLALSGESGLQFVTELAELAPDSSIVVVSPFAALREEAQAAGAVGLVALDDIRAVEGHLLQIPGAAHTDCTCCPPSDG